MPKPLETTASHDNQAAQPSESEPAKPAEQGKTDKATLDSSVPKSEDVHPEAPGSADPAAEEESAATKEAVAASEEIQGDAKPVSEAAEPVPEPDVADGAPKSAEAGSDKSSQNVVEKAAEQIIKKVEKAEDAAVKMLAKNLDVGAGREDSNGTQEEEPMAEAASQSDEKSPATGDKRKAEEVLGLNGDHNVASTKLNIEAAPPAPATNGNGTARKPGRPKKEKNKPNPAGRTARRTRSQGLGDA